MLIGFRKLSADITTLYNSSKCNYNCSSGSSSSGEGGAILYGGNVVGEIVLSRSALTGDIFFIYVHDSMRGSGYGVELYRLFERAVKERSASVGMKVALIRITLKQCIVKSTSFWKKLGFIGSETSACLTKQINFN